ncbi:hypothetical protein RCH21_002667 [Arthrobacter sp. PL16]|uniref:hypothetical protein n=1 Tax=Arthrobacter sp. PL16 TaxID=3071720 RepID=UPI002DF7D52F|nr:hypothetical protein [Arthrobacter sp. PL16]
MCGACGRTVVADPTLGPVRRTRDLLVVAQIVNAVTSGLPGAPTARVSGDGFVLAGRTGRSTPCDTIEDLWRVLHDVVAPGALSDLARRIARGLPAATPLADRVLRAGLSARAR